MSLLDAKSIASNDSVPQSTVKINLVPLSINFLKDYDEAKYLQETGESLGEEDERSVADLLIDQIEFADVILISKTDLVKERDIEKLNAILRTLNRHARIIPIKNGNVDVEDVIASILIVDDLRIQKN